MYRELSRSDVTLILGALVLVMILLSGCGTSTPVATLTAPPRATTNTPVPPTSTPAELPAISTPVPIATWIAQGIPGDTFISYDWEDVCASEHGAKVTITADGAVTSESWYGSRYDAEQRKGKISPSDLGRILITLDEINFFALASDGMCIYYRTRPPIPSEIRGGTTYMDFTRMQFSVTVHGLSGSLSTLVRGGPPQKCLKDGTASEAFDRLVATILDAGRQVALLTPTPSH